MIGRDQLKMQSGESRALFFPLFGNRVVGIVAVIFMLGLPIAALLIPAALTMNFSAFATVDALAMAERSSFPAAVEICYSGAVYAGIGIGLFFGFCNINLIAGIEIIRKLSLFWRLLIPFIYIFFMWLFICYELPFSQANKGFFYWVANQRIFLALWVFSLFVNVVCLTILVLINIKEFLGKLNG